MMKARAKARAFIIHHSSFIIHQDAQPFDH